MDRGVVDVEDEGGGSVGQHENQLVQRKELGLLLSWSLWLANFHSVNREAWMLIYPDAVKCRFVVGRNAVDCELKPRLPLVTLGALVTGSQGTYPLSHCP